MRSGSRAVIFSLMVLITFATLVFAQNGTTSLRGAVSDAKGALLPDATVTVADSKTSYSRSVKTDAHGEYQFVQLPPSTYSITVNATGFAQVKQEGVQLLVSVPSTINF